MKDIGSIRGKEEFFHDNVVGYDLQFLRLCEFYGGKDRGKCLQLSIYNKHIQIEKENIIHLRNILLNFLDNFGAHELLLDKNKSEILTK